MWENQGRSSASQVKHHITPATMVFPLNQQQQYQGPFYALQDPAFHGNCVTLEKYHNDLKIEIDAWKVRMDNLGKEHNRKFHEIDKIVVEKSQQITELQLKLTCKDSFIAELQNTVSSLQNTLVFNEREIARLTLSIKEAEQSNARQVYNNNNNNPKNTVPRAQNPTTNTPTYGQPNNSYDNSWPPLPKPSHRRKPGPASHETRNLRESQRSSTPPTPKMTYEEVNGDLFSAPADFAKAHAVDATLQMSKGIAATFKENYIGYEALRGHEWDIGDVPIIETGIKTAPILNVITKSKHYHKFGRNRHARSFKKNFIRGLHGLKQVCMDKGINKLALPPLGTGLDRLPWKFVKEQIHKTFSDCSIHVKVYFKREQVKVSSLLTPTNTTSAPNPATDPAKVPPADPKSLMQDFPQDQESTSPPESTTSAHNSSVPRQTKNRTETEKVTTPYPECQAEQNIKTGTVTPPQENLNNKEKPTLTSPAQVTVDEETCTKDNNSSTSKSTPTHHEYANPHQTQQHLPNAITTTINPQNNILSLQIPRSLTCCNEVSIVDMHYKDNSVQTIAFVNKIFDRDNTPVMPFQ
jgi:hypothetical protein